MFTRVVPNLNAFLSNAEYKGRYFGEHCGVQTTLDPTDIHWMGKKKLFWNILFWVLRKSFLGERCLYSYVHIYEVHLKVTSFLFVFAEYAKHFPEDRTTKSLYHQYKSTSFQPWCCLRIRNVGSVTSVTLASTAFPGLSTVTTHSAPPVWRQWGSITAACAPFAVPSVVRWPVWTVASACRRLFLLIANCGTTFVKNRRRKRTRDSRKRRTRRKTLIYRCCPHHRLNGEWVTDMTTWSICLFKNAIIFLFFFVKNDPDDRKKAITRIKFSKRKH